MRTGNTISNKNFTKELLLQNIAQWKVVDKTVAFTNGCFDILHPGHIASLTEAAASADYLVVALNTDTSVQKLKGPQRPVNNEEARALIIASLCMVDAVVLFAEETPRELIVTLRPDVLIKGGDYKIEDIAGAKEVLSWGGKVIINPLIPGYSTSEIIKRSGKLQDGTKNANL